jgi:polysaccharide deacetylase 2 family uncharacterized protein YibQ
MPYNFSTLNLKPTLPLSVLALVSSLLVAYAHADPMSESDSRKVQIAIIIDDIGYNMSQGLKAAHFPGALTLSVLPFAPNSRAIAELAHKQGKELMLHAPMSTVEPRPLDQGALTEAMSENEFLTVLRENLLIIPNIVGINNHMGSYLTQQPEPMQWLMDELEQYPLFFLDSRTSPNSIAWETAKDNKIPALKRDIFLDNDPSIEAISKQYNQLLKLAHKNGSAIAIGHPNKNTIDFLYKQTDLFAEQGVELISVSSLLDTTYEPSTTLPNEGTLKEGIGTHEVTQNEIMTSNPVITQTSYIEDNIKDMTVNLSPEQIVY